MPLVEEEGTAPASLEEGGGAPGSRPEDRVKDPERFTGHRVRLRVFEGPLDLLLHLIRAHRYDIFDIPISEITTQFLEYLRLMEELELEYAGDFMVMAASLMQIKARMLLPPEEKEESDEEGAGPDPRVELVERLLEYQRYQDAAGSLRDLRERRMSLFPRADEALEAQWRTSWADEETTPLLLDKVTSFDLLQALRRVLERVADRPLTVYIREPFTVPDRIRHLIAAVSARDGARTFTALCADCETRLEVVITFLALLELIRRGRVVVRQDDLFEEIIVEPSRGATA